MKIPGIKGFDEEAFLKYFKNTGWLMFGKIMSMVVNLIIANYLGAISFGDLSFADALTAIVAAVGTLGLDSFIIREIIKSRMEDGQLDASQITLQDLQVIREVFVTTLQGMFHPRIPYPVLPVAGAAQPDALPGSTASAGRLSASNEVAP